MTRRTLIWRSATYHWRTNLAVAVGAAIGTAVLTGALLVGDSMRSSLLRLTLARLGRIDHALVAQRFFRQELAADLTDSAAFRNRFGPRATVAASILIQGTLERHDQRGNVTGRTSGVNVVGIDQAFLHLFTNAPSSPPAGEDAWLNDAAARELGAATGERILLQIEQPSALPRETLLGRRQEIMRTGTYRVERVALPEGLNRFGLRPNQLQPKNVFVPLASLQQTLDRKGYANALLIAADQSRNLTQAQATSEQLATLLDEQLLLEDLGLVLRSPAIRVARLFARNDRDGDNQLAGGELRRLPDVLPQRVDTNGDHQLSRDEVEAYYRQYRNYLLLESDRLLLEPVVVRAAAAAAERTGLTAAPILGYLVNDMAIGENHVRYSIVTATPTPMSGHAVEGSEILLTTWAAERLGAERGDELTLTYYLPESEEGRLPTAETVLRVGGITQLSHEVVDDGWTPDYPGITDADNIADWDPPYPEFIDFDKITEADEEYWQDYRAAPKAFIALATGRRLWSSRFGDTTSIRFSAPSNAELSAVHDLLVSALLEELRPQQLGLTFQPVRAEGVRASRGGTDFAGLFAGFSLFLIVSAALLVGLLFRMNIEQRARQIGLLLATGQTVGQVRTALLVEGGGLVAMAGLLGLAAGVGYGWLMVYGLTTWWIQAIRTPFLQLAVTPASLVIGYVAGVLVALLSVVWAVRGLARLSPRALLAGHATVASMAGDSSRSRRRAPATAAVGGTIALVMVILGFTTDVVPEVAVVLIGGTAALVASLALMAAIIINEPDTSRIRPGFGSLLRVATRNTVRHRSRSLLTMSLIAVATFSIVVVAANRHEVGENVYAKDGGTGGYRLLAEAAAPLHHLFGSADSRRALNIPREADDLIERAMIHAFRVRPGDEASCLNLYRPTEPRLIGAPDEFIHSGRFHFSDALTQSDREQANPWLVLHQDLGDDVIPAAGDYNTVKWILHLGLGQELTLRDDHGQDVHLRIVGLLSGSILQSELIISEAQLKRHFPSQAGYRFFLIDVAAEQADELSTILESALGEYGFDVTETGRRLAEYMTIENTYLDTFRTLGGLGVLLGTVGMGIVLLRNVLERRGELALLRALGFRRRRLGLLVVAENALLLVLGLAAGTASALLAVAPHLYTGAAGVPWLPLLSTLALVLIIGLASGLGAVAMTLSAPLLPALRSE